MAVILKGTDLTLEDVGCECHGENLSRVALLIMQADKKKVSGLMWREGDDILLRIDGHNGDILVNQSYLDQVSRIEFSVLVS